MVHYLEVIDNLLTPEECNKYMAMINENRDGLVENIDNGLATYNRLLFIDNDFANELFERIKPYLKEHNIQQRKKSKKAPIIDFKRVNDHFRISKYDEGGEFKIHKDGINADSLGGRSCLTLNIFLNDNFEGGETDFYHNDKKTLRESIKPKPGRAGLFYSQQYHCGNKVPKGNKYLLRTDVMV